MLLAIVATGRWLSVSFGICARDGLCAHSCHAAVAFVFTPMGLRADRAGQTLVLVQLGEGVVGLFVLFCPVSGHSHVFIVFENYGGSGHLTSSYCILVQDSSETKRSAATQWGSHRIYFLIPT